ncbi:MAG: lytic transglycosylase domain-containing protein [Sneathiella sp.]
MVFFALAVAWAGILCAPATANAVTFIEEDDIDRHSRKSPTKQILAKPVPVPRAYPTKLSALPSAAISRSSPKPRSRPGSLMLPPPPFATGLLSNADRKHYYAAFKALKARQWRTAQNHANKATYSLPAKYIQWSWLRTYKGGASFDDITLFMIDNPDWPYRHTLMRRAEQALVNPVSVDRTLSWFADRTPLTGMGMLRYGEALLANGDTAQGAQWIRTAWKEGNFSKKLEKKIKKNHKLILSETDHEGRLNRLLWDKRAEDAIRLLDYVSNTQKKLAVARIRLMRMSKNVDAALAQIPSSELNNPGLLYERAKWRRRKGKHEDARDILLEQDETAPRADKWWLERQIQARKLLRMGHISQAYQLVSKHGLEPGGKFAAAEWEAGWIALRFLHDYDVALTHFNRLYNNVSFPISRSRGAYWLGRTYVAKKDTKSAEYWFGEASSYASTFYGLVAMKEIDQSTLPTIRVSAKPQAGTVLKAEKSELVKIVKHLAELGESKRARPFLLALTEKATSIEEYTYIGALAHEIDRPDYAIAVAKRASQLGTELTHISWPTTSHAPENPPIELPLILAITRQESAFAEDAISPVGARGLMQLMPATAKSVSRKLKISYSKNKLTSQPDYNTLLGSTYLNGLIRKYDGSYIMAIAAYNAGSSRVYRWTKEWGDPRKGEIDVIDWIELIPFKETRNYVQRVMENLQVYRQLLRKSGYRTVQIGNDLKRGHSTF